MLVWPALALGGGGVAEASGADVSDGRLSTNEERERYYLELS
jgi:hypothetical protein